MPKIPGNKDKKQNKQKVYTATVKNFEKVVRQAIAENRPDPESDYVAFSLQYLNRENFDGCEWDDKLALLDTMNTLSRVTWKQVHTLHRHKLGYETIPHRNIKAPISSEVPQDVRFIVFRFSGMKPMIGFRQGCIFYIVWLDTDFSAYDHE